MPKQVHHHILYIFMGLKHYFIHCQEENEDYNILDIDAHNTMYIRIQGDLNSNLNNINVCFYTIHTSLSQAKTY